MVACREQLTVRLVGGEKYSPWSLFFKQIFQLITNKKGETMHKIAQMGKQYNGRKKCTLTTVCTQASRKAD